MHHKLQWLGFIFLASCLLAGANILASAQGRGHGQGGGPPAGGGVGRGIDTSSDRSDGRSDTGRSMASDRSNGRSDAGPNRAAMQRENSAAAVRELNDHPEMAARLHTTANDLRRSYQAALLTNPNLKFGQFVAATRVAANLHSRHPNVTTAAILAGLANGKSIGQTLHNLGVGKDEAKEAEKTADREIKDARGR